MNRSLVRVLTLTVLVSSLGGCFRYVPVPLEAVPPGESVRLLVTRQGVSELTEVTEVEGAAPQVQGTLLGLEESTLMLRVPVGARQEGIHTVRLEQTIRIPEGEVLQVERREVDPLKTIGLLAVGVAGGTAMILSIMEAFGESSPRRDPSPPEESRIPIPLLRVPIGR